jgi:hypothetical protein
LSGKPDRALYDFPDKSNPHYDLSHESTYLQLRLLVLFVVEKALEKTLSLKRPSLFAFFKNASKSVDPAAGRGLCFSVNP